MSRSYEVPKFLDQRLSQAGYDRWLQRKAAAHVRRDRKRGNRTAMVAAYKIAIHQAVMLCRGRDVYTDELLDWSLCGKYNNVESQTGRRAYKARLALLPTVDHVGDGLGPADFKICAWRTNDAKHDLTYEEFVTLCRRVVAHFEKGALSG